MYRLLFPFLLLLLAACGGDTHDAHNTSSAEPTPAQVEDGVQVLAIEAGLSGYSPRAITLEADVPARLVFTRTVDSECSAQVSIPTFDIAPTDLPMNEPVAIEFTPTVAGEFEFVCGMDMQRGSIMIQS